MKPLHTVVAICLLITVTALPENIEDVKELPQSKEPIVEAEESETSPRKERCSSCATKFNVKSPNDVLAAIQALPGAEVHTQQSFEGCSSDKGCAGIKVKDGRVIERFGNVDAFRAAAAADTANEFNFHAAGTFGNNVFEGGLPGNGPFWWMNQDSPFKSGDSGGNFEKFSKSSSSSFSSSGSTGAGGIDISANPFLNGGFVAGAAGGAQGGKPASAFESSSFESSSFSSKGNIDLSKNPFLNGGVKLGQGGFQAQGGFGSSQGSSQFGSQSSGFGATGQSASFGAGSQSAGFGAGSQTTGFGAGSQTAGFGAGSQTAGFGAGSQSSGSATGSQSGYGASSQGSGLNAQGAFNSGSQSGSSFQSSSSGFQSFGAGQTTGSSQGASSQGGYNSGSFSGNKFAGSGFVGSSPRPFTASTPGAGINLIQNTQKTSEFDYSQSVNIDESSRGTTGVSSGGALQQTCSGQGYVCVHKAQCNNGVVNSNGAAVLQANSQKQYCDVRTEICCRLETASLPGTVGLQGSLGVGSATTTGSYQGSNLFATGQNSGQSQSNAFGSSQSNFGSTGQFNSGTTSSFGSNSGVKGGVTASGFGTGGFGFSTAAPTTTNRFNNEVYKSTSQSNFIETDSFSSGSESAGVYRPGASGSGLKPGIPYLPPIDSKNQPTNLYPSTVFTSTTTPRPVTTARPTYLPPTPPRTPSTSAPTYLPPDQHKEGSIILDSFQQTTRAPQIPINDISTACAAALKCTAVEYCTADGVISTTPVILTKEQDAFRVPLTDCRDLGTGVIGKCCRDPNYTDPWPTNLLGQWNDTFFGNNGKYVPDNRGSPNNNPPVYREKVTPSPFGPNQITPGFPTRTTTTGSGLQISQGGGGSFNVGGRGQYEAGASGQTSLSGQREDSQVTQTTQQFQTANFNRNNQGQAVVIGQGQGAYTGEGQGVRQGQGSYQTNKQYTVGSIQADAVRTQNNFGQAAVSGQAGTGIRQGVGTGVSQGFGVGVTQGIGAGVKQGSRFGVTQGTSSSEISQTVGVAQGGSVSQGSGASQGFGSAVSQGVGTGVSQGFGTGVRQGVGSYGISRTGSTVEQQYSEVIYRVFLQQYSGSGQCGVLNSQTPYGNRNELEVDFSEIPWQAMVLLQTNKSLLCGGVITRPDVVLTSAACVDGLDAKNVLIKGGEWKLGIDDEPLPFQIVQVKHILRHPFYNRGSLQYDAAILVLSENLRLANNILPICLPGPDDTLDAFYNGAGECIVTGWGKQVLQAHLSGSILHSVNVSLINPGECQAKLSQDYPHLLEQYDQDSCVCGQPTNPTNNICKVDIGSALACTTSGYYVLRGVYSWDSGCQPGNQVAGFYKFDLEWYQWAIGLIESARFAQFSGNTQSGGRFSGQISSGGSSSSRGNQFVGGIKIGGGIGASGQFGQNKFSSVQSQITGNRIAGEAVGTGSFQNQFQTGQSKIQGGQSQFLGGSNQLQGSQGTFQSGQTGFQAQLPLGQNQFTSSVGQFGSSKYQSGSSSSGATVQSSAPVSNTFTATYTEKKIFQSEPKIVTYTTKPEIVTFTTKPEYFTYTTQPKVFSYTTKPQVITYETSGSGTNPQYAAPNVSFNPTFTDAVKGHAHSAQCKCLQNGKK
ncbi:serine-rich adhesin for platelets [Galleria mellonella]|uniref:Serine-rich adhesin for platelets n=1 Tax=Galleria mellonella TaxID=7137 RepID=A0ABM3N337_GALME|nr:serine-rich adhesin for platelets [Galleria mellonella]